MSSSTAAGQVHNSVHRDWLQRFATARARTDELFGLVRPEAIYDRPIPERHRILFYLGHLEAFDANLILRDTFGIAPFHEKFDRLFAFGIDPVGGKLPDDKPSDWPALHEIHDYVKRVRLAVDECVVRAAGVSLAHPHLENDLIFHVAVEHRLMHAETLTYMLHHLPLNRKIAVFASAILEATPITPRLVDIPAGIATLGLERAGTGKSRQSGGDNFGGKFGWDNEFEAHTIQVPAFAVDAYKVTNRQFLEFLHSGGYDERSHWTPDAWEWKTKNRIRHPGLWVAHGQDNSRLKSSDWHLKTMFDEIPLPLDWPVYVSHAEASAYARWRHAELPTEAQFHRAAWGTPQGGEREFPWADAAVEQKNTNWKTCGNFDFARWDPAPVGAHLDGASAFGVDELLGNGWEWTSTIFGPFAGFRAFSFYPGYSADFFDGKHYVMKGASPRTAACFLRRSFRNWFQPHYPYIYAAFRCVQN
ncbi:MAG: SUMF1/EgtB/PvdO family nonheme iron enzyme [Acidipila sp.]|nr:SUMF1/EgtB/PvdO family nonheme iron enzyme [Acidipila sp.]